MFHIGGRILKDEESDGGELVFASEGELGMDSSEELIKGRLILLLLLLRSFFSSSMLSFLSEWF